MNHINIDKAKSISGYMMDSELEWLAQQAAGAKIIIELGSWKGRSSRALADNLPAGGKIYCIDTFAGSSDEADGTHQEAALSGADYIFQEFYKNNSEHVLSGTIVPLRMTSDSASTLLKTSGIKADLIFIDGGHTYPEVCKDIDNLKDLLTEGGTLCGHDFEDPWPGVQKAVREKIAGFKVAPGTHIWYCSKKNIIEDVVTQPVTQTHLPVTVGIPTKDRYDLLALTLVSVAMQTKLPEALIIVDDSIERKDIRDLEVLRYSLHLLGHKGIKWSVLHGPRKGPQWCHQMVQDGAQTPFIWRIDDDEIAEPNVLEELYSTITKDDKVGAVAGLVIHPGNTWHGPPRPNSCREKEMYNCQWHSWSTLDKTVECEHLYSSFLYRKGLQTFDLSLSPAGHREENLFSWGLFKQGYKLLVTREAVSWHYRSSGGGIRTSKKEDFDRDELYFQELLREDLGHKVVLLNSGAGDHLVFKTAILPKLKEKFKKVTIACTFPNLFVGEDVISVSEGATLVDQQRHDIYRFMAYRDYKKELKFAFAEMYGVTL